MARCDPPIRVRMIREMIAPDVPALALQPSQVGRLGIHEPVRDLAHGHELAASGPAWTALGTDGRILCIAGFAEIFAGRHAIAWALIAEGVPLASHVTIQRFMRRKLAEQPFRRIEAVARATSAAEQNWLRRLGFEIEGVMEDWGPLSEPHVLFRYAGKRGQA